MLAPPDQINHELENLAAGKPPTQVLPIDLWARDYEEINVFDWQDAVAGMLSASDLEVELAAAEGRIRAAIARGLIAPDHTLTLGERTYHYFLRDRAEEIREALGLPRVDDASIRELFLDFVERMDMSSSYKPVMLLAILDHVDDRGRAPIDAVASTFHAFYLDRLRQGLAVERPGMRMARRIGSRSRTSARSCSGCRSGSSSSGSTWRMTGKTWLISGSSRRCGASSPTRTGPRSAATARGRSPSIMSDSSPDPCPFCAMPEDRIVEAREHAFAVLDAYPVSPGHTLVIARRHVPDAFDLTADEIADILHLIGSARDRIDRTLRPSGYNIGVNIGRDAGQTVMHVHIHVIPRYPGDCEDPTGGVRGVIPARAGYP